MNYPPPLRMRRDSAARSPQSGQPSPYEGETGQARSVGRLLRESRYQLETAGADSPWLTALVLLEHSTGTQRAALLAHPEAGTTSESAASFRQLVERRAAREPLAYLLGYRDFYGRRFAVSPSTLIPRTETEGLVDLAIERLGRRSGERVRGTPSPLRMRRDSAARSPQSGQPSPRERGGRYLRLLDVGTGSGAIAVSVLAERPGIAALATDAAPEALAVARENARVHDVSDRLRFVTCDLASAVHAQFSVVVANLPYVPTADLEALEPEVARYEPRAALDGGPDGTSVIRRFLASLPGVLAPGGTALLEIGDGQADALFRFSQELLVHYQVAVAPDHAGADRFLIVERPVR